MPPTSLAPPKHHLRQPLDIGKLFLFAGEEEEIAFLCGKFLILYGFISGGGMAAADYPNREKRAPKSETLIPGITPYPTVLLAVRATLYG